MPTEPSDVPIPDPACPLCGAEHVEPFADAYGRRYLECGECRLIHLDPHLRLDPAEELAHYRTHQNDPSDAGYRAFLGRLAQPLACRLPRGAEGLDYGSGPGPTLSLMMEEMGFRTAVYDPYFAPGTQALDHEYDFVTCSEAVEHFSRPGAEFGRLARLLRPGGWLGVMTTIFRDETTFGRWYYARDPTHVAFYRDETMDWLARRYSWALERPDPNVALFRDTGR